MNRMTSEAELLRTVIDMAHLYRWRAYHGLPSLTTAGRWHTAAQGDRGFVDLVLARNGVVLCPELKAEKGRLGPGQAEWGTELGQHYRLWRPSMLDAIARELR